MRSHFSHRVDAAAVINFEIGDGQRRVTLSVGDRTIYGDDVETVFWRVKSQMMGLPSNDEERYDDDFRFREWRATVAGLNSALDNALWLNPYDHHTYAGTKLLQLNIASDVGLKIPATVVGNDPSRVLALFDRGEVIYKSLSSPFYSPEHLILTSKVSREAFQERWEMVSSAPCLFQHYVEKAYELRITIVGNSMIPVRINSQATEDTRTDWRTAQTREGMYSVGLLPKEVVRNLRKIMSRLGLVYGAVDMIVTPNDEYVFLEVNPGGQWLWMEEMIGVPITAEIAHYMVHRRPAKFGC